MINLNNKRPKFSNLYYLIHLYNNIHKRFLNVFIRCLAFLNSKQLNVKLFVFYIKHKFTIMINKNHIIKIIIFVRNLSVNDFKIKLIKNNALTRALVDVGFMGITSSYKVSKRTIKVIQTSFANFSLFYYHFTFNYFAHKMIYDFLILFVISLIFKQSTTAHCFWLAELLVSEPLETANDDNPETGVIIYPTIITTIAELLVSEPYHDTTDSDSSSDSASLPDSSSDSSQEQLLLSVPDFPDTTHLFHKYCSIIEHCKDETELFNYSMAYVKHHIPPSMFVTTQEEMREPTAIIHQYVDSLAQVEISSEEEEFVLPLLQAAITTYNSVLLIPNVDPEIIKKIFLQSAALYQKALKT